MEIEATSLRDVLLLKPRVFRDKRGFFMESFNEKVFRKAGISTTFVQDNVSRSTKNVLRGIHLQSPHAQGKLIRVARGCVFDVAVDLRKGSPSFGEWCGFILNDENCHQLWIPPGFGHGFVTISDVADFEYKCTDFYHPECEICIHWSDPDIGIQWPDTIAPLVSEKDAKGLSLEEYQSRLR